MVIPLLLRLRHGRRDVAGVDFILEADFLVGAVAMRLAIWLIRFRVGSTCDFETL